MSEVERNVFVVFTNSEDGLDDEFNRWYDEHHLREIVGVDGFVSGQRFELHPVQRPGRPDPPWKYLALYEIEGDVGAIHGHLAEASPSFVKSDALKNDHVAWVFSTRGERVEHSSEPAATTVAGTSSKGTD
jgi:hypothetical protein